MPTFGNQNEEHMEEKGIFIRLCISDLQAGKKMAARCLTKQIPIIRVFFSWCQAEQHAGDTLPQSFQPPRAVFLPHFVNIF